MVQPTATGNADPLSLKARAAALGRARSPNGKGKRQAIELKCERVDEMC